MSTETAGQLQRNVGDTVSFVIRPGGEICPGLMCGAVDLVRDVDAHLLIRVFFYVSTNRVHAMKTTRQSFLRFLSLAACEKAEQGYMATARGLKGVSK